MDDVLFLAMKLYTPDFNSGEEVRTCLIEGRTQ